MENNLIKIKEEDKVAVAYKDLAAGDIVKIGGEEIEIKENIGRDHKLALCDIKKGEEVIKYGNPIGKAQVDIARGEKVHTHNVETNLEGKLSYNYNPQPEEEIITPASDIDNAPTFLGYPRANGKTGIRNEIWLVNTVGCVNKPVEKMAQEARKQYRAEIKKGEIEGIFNFPHPWGCSQLGDDLKNTQKVLAGLVNHPNAGAVLVVGLGCENNNIEEFKKVIGDYNTDRVKFINLQQVKNGQEKALKKIGKLVDYASQFKREETSVSQLKIGLKCGGSDSFSGITANPLLGEISNKVVKYGGAAVLTEVPEMFGAETILMNRARDKETFEKIVDLINDFKDYFISHDQPIYENPAPGNKEGGITTLEEKSLGCIEKGGKCQVNGVIPYGDQVQGQGLQLLQSPGNDLVSVGALAVSGVQLILFTTGRGTPYGAPVPTVKVATNTELYERKKNWMDFNAGRMLEDISKEELGEEFFEYLLEVISGKTKAKNEINDCREIAMFKTGVTV